MKYEKYLNEEIVDLMKLENAVQRWLAECQKIIDAYYKKMYANTQSAGLTAKLSYTKGPKYYKVLSTSSTGGAGNAVWAFIDKEGNIFKPASWKAPAKGVRGNLFDVHNGLLHIGPYGPAYKANMK